MAKVAGQQQQQDIFGSELGGFLKIWLNLEGKRRGKHFKKLDLLIYQLRIFLLY